eukprot:232501_1
MLSKEHQEYLCDGFIRNNFIHATPIAVNRIIQQFWNEYIWWTFKGTTLTKFLNAKLEDEFEQEEFKIGHIKCVPSMYPNGGVPEYEGEVSCGIDFELLNENIKSVLVYTELYCLQTKFHYKNTDIVSHDTDNLLLWAEPMKLSQCINKKQLDFMYFVDILRIEYDNNCKEKNYYKDIKISNKSECKWNCDSLVIESWKNSGGSQSTSVCGPSFDNKCWVLWATPYDDSDTFSVGISLLRMPYDVKQINVKMILDIEPNIFHCQVTETVTTVMDTWHLYRDTKLKLNDIIQKANDCDIEIHCSVEIVDTL